MTLEDINNVALKIKQLEDIGDLRITYSTEIPNAVCLSNSEKFVIVINPNLSWEQQVKELWHEAKHIYSHMNKSGIYSIEIAEREADEFMNKAVSSNILYELKTL